MPSSASPSSIDGPLPSLDELIEIPSVPVVIEPIIGKRLDKSAIERWVRDHGLRVVLISRKRFTTRKWLMEFFAERAAQRASRSSSDSSNAKGAKRRRRRAPGGRGPAVETDSVLRRLGIREGGME